MLLTLSSGVVLIMFMIAGKAIRISLLLRHFRNEENKDVERARDRPAYVRAPQPHPTTS